MKKVLFLLLVIILATPQNAFAKKIKSNSLENNGYVGTLPDITKRFQGEQQKSSTPSFEYQDGFNNPNEIKPAPRNNPAFINIIVKKDKTSPYINDLNEIIQIVEKLQNIIEDKKDVQKFNAQSYYLDKNVEYFRDKYKNKAEESYISYKRLMQLNTQVQAVSQLRLEREIYSPYIAGEGSGNSFSQNNINLQLDYLLENIRSTLAVMKEDK